MYLFRTNSRMHIAYTVYIHIRMIGKRIVRNFKV